MTASIFPDTYTSVQLDGAFKGTFYAAVATTPQSGLSTPLALVVNHGSSYIPLPLIHKNSTKGGVVWVFYGTITSTPVKFTLIVNGTSPMANTSVSFYMKSNPATSRTLGYIVRKTVAMLTAMVRPRLTPSSETIVVKQDDPTPPPQSAPSNLVTEFGKGYCWAEAMSNAGCIVTREGGKLIFEND